MSEVPRFYYDLSAKQLMAMGNVALEESIEQSEYLQSLLDQDRLEVQAEDWSAPHNCPLWAELLVNQSLVIDPLTLAERLDVSQWPKSTYIDFARFMHHLVSVEYPGRRLNENIIRRNQLMGLGPSRDHIGAQSRFGTISELYRQADLTQPHRIGVFDGMSDRQLISMVRQEGLKLGKAPPAHHMAEKARNDPNFPGVHIYKRRFGNGAWNKVIELAGWFSADGATNDDYISWGKRFMLANKGLIFSARHMNILSKKGKGASARSVQNRFSEGLSELQPLAIAAYDEEVRRRIEDRRRQLSHLKCDLEKGVLPPTLFEGANTKAEKLRRYAKYLVVNKLAPEWRKETKLAISDGSRKGFVRSIRRVNPAITAGDIEETALFLGVFDYIWSPDENLGGLVLSEREVKGAKPGGKIRWHIVGASHEKPTS